MTLNTSLEFPRTLPPYFDGIDESVARVDLLMHRSDIVYDHIDKIQNGEPRYRRMLRIGINAVGTALKDGDSVQQVGRRLISLSPTAKPLPNGPLDTLSNTYADVRRATLDREGNAEADGRHAIHLMKLAVPYAARYYPYLDTGKIAVYALLHDIVEAYADDTPSLGISAAQMEQKNLIEAQALETLEKEYGDAFPELVQLVEAYESLSDDEAKFNKTFDKLDPGFTHFYTRGSQLLNRYNYDRPNFLRAIDETTVRMQVYAGGFPELMADRDELTRRVADITFQHAA